jgi:hypothetical protein
MMHFVQRVGRLARNPRRAWRRVLTGPRAPLPPWSTRTFGRLDPLAAFQRNFAGHLAACAWEPHERFSVFTQYDQSFYLARRMAFLHKYQCFYALSKTICPKRIIEMGTHAGAGADAYMSGAPDAEYLGLDRFEDGVLRGVVHEVSGIPWRPRQIALQLFAARGFTRFRLLQVDLRSLDRLPSRADLVVVDAAHDFTNAYADLRLALTADPSYIFVDDADETEGVVPAITEFLRKDVSDRVDFFCGIPYFGGGLVIRLNAGALEVVSRQSDRGGRN